ncbi:hypothetical protein [Nocardioides coralli]|uniref:hypothetical protein n=1 Tax=Nocardioides coralli TaxID=2872154 RepID=UPI001CA45D47|nr:hypothetical protein [Nocardioides coralli]QZY30344.1 hypothetical protein K6T13_06715 [Nocardioides coralli]
MTERPWTWADLRRPLVALTALVAFALTLPLAVVGSCNVHELGHAAVGTALGWEVDRVVPCLPSGGEVRYLSSDAAGDAVEGWAGGLAGALALLVAYALVCRGGRPLRSPVAWAAGLALSVPVGVQLVIAAVEGSAGLGEDYTDTIAAHTGVFVPVLLLGALTGPTAHVWWWRVRARRS